MQPDTTPHRQTLWRLVRMAQAIVVSDGCTEDLHRLEEEAPHINMATFDAMHFAKREGRGVAREAWPMLSQSCWIALRAIVSDDAGEAARADVVRWKTIVGMLLPIVAADWQAWRDAVAPKIGGQVHE